MSTKLRASTFNSIIDSVTKGGASISFSFCKFNTAKLKLDLSSREKYRSEIYINVKVDFIFL